MALQLNDLSNEILCKILDFLKTDKKFQVRTVCKRWKSQIDENCSFHVLINDKNYSFIRERFGTSRVVKSICISNYGKESVPIQNLNFLRYLSVGAWVHKAAVADVLVRAVQLNEVNVEVNHSKENSTIPQSTARTSYPALLNISKLCISYNNKSFVSERAWNSLLYCEMPNVKCLEVILHGGVPPLRGFDFFRLVAGMPKINLFTFQPFCCVKTSRFMLSGDVQPLTRDICTALSKLILTKVDAIVLKKDEDVWKDLLASQRQLQEINLKNESHTNEGFHLSIIHSVLQNCKETIQRLYLDVDTQMTGDVDAAMFSDFVSLQEVTLDAFPFRKSLRSIRNIYSIVNATLGKLFIRGFKVEEEDVINVVKNIPKAELNRVQIGPELSFVWTDFEHRLDEMGILKCEHCTNDSTEYIFTSKHQTPKVYYGMYLEKNKVKNVTVEPYSLYVANDYW